MKSFKYLFLILSTIFIFEILNSNKAEACTITSGVVSESDINKTLISMIIIICMANFKR